MARQDWDKATDDWLASLGGLLTAPESVFWWPGLAVGLVGAVWYGRQSGLWGRAADYWRELPIDAGCFLANSTLPFLLAPWLLGLVLIGNRLGAVLAGMVVGTTPGGAPGWPLLLAAAFFAFVAGDFALYWTHRLFHGVPLLWRSHRLHHAPPVLTPLTAFRFWPWEQAVHISANMLAQGLGLGLAAGLAGAQVPALTVLGVNIFTLAWGLGFAHLRHSAVPLPFPGWLSRWLISPHMHQLHHSMALQHRDRNFGTALAIWDRMFGTYVLPEKEERFRFGTDEASPHPLPGPGGQA
ncbi:sterol desaturase family protein [Niveispirillum sp. KHB5.9]|uniref:sterol desaturase family protein n=1 Tax=Niveispirillum sp. KHB5.9 TaxID=3400269 RepID=UPI003A85FCBF